MSSFSAPISYESAKGIQTPELPKAGLEAFPGSLVIEFVAFAV